MTLHCLLQRLARVLRIRTVQGLNSFPNIDRHWEDLELSRSGPQLILTPVLDVESCSENAHSNYDATIVPISFSFDTDQDVWNLLEPNGVGTQPVQENQIEDSSVCKYSAERLCCG